MVEARLCFGHWAPAIPSFKKSEQKQEYFCLLELFALLKAGGTTHFSFSPRSYTIYIYINKYTKVNTSCSLIYRHCHSTPAGCHVENCWGQNPGSAPTAGGYGIQSHWQGDQASARMSGTAAARVHIQKYTPHVRTDTLSQRPANMDSQICASSLHTQACKSTGKSTLSDQQITCNHLWPLTHSPSPKAHPVPVCPILQSLINPSESCWGAAILHIFTHVISNRN